MCYFSIHFPYNKHQSNPLVSAETVRQSSTYIILYITRRYALSENKILSWNAN